MSTDRAGIHATRQSMAVQAVEGLEQNAGVDPLREFYHGVAGSLPGGRVLEELQGRSLGHALHPLLTDLPLGTWMSASLLDLLGGGKHREGAKKLVGLGVLFAVPTALSGFADFRRLHSVEAERVASVHAVMNGWGVITYATSWMLRRKGKHRAGAALALVGGVGLTVSGYLGGHLSLRRGEPEGAE